MFTDFFAGIAKYALLFIAVVVFIIYLLVRPGNLERQMRRQLNEKEKAMSSAQKNNEEK